MVKGDQIHFWYDPWIDCRALIDPFLGINIYDLDIDKHALLCNVWRRGRWALPDSVDEVVVHVW